ncbi:MAG: hypothetical protein JZU47_08800 [Prolixibacteraceae bacterium]|nr:hypothetical protein [Prolixibacteraceae bacterium]
MNLFELHNSLTITERKINGIPLIKTKIESQLNALKARTNVSANKIDFKTIKIIYGLGNTEASPILLRIYKEGSVVIDKHGGSLIITWTVKLDTLYAMAFSIAFISLIITSIVTQLIFSFIIGIAVFLAVVFIGVLFILASMNELVLSSVYKK